MADNGSPLGTTSHLQAAEERNYHIFYSMLMGMGAEEKHLLGLGTPSEYHYLTMVSQIRVFLSRVPSLPISCKPLLENTLWSAPSPASLPSSPGELLSPEPMGSTTQAAFLPVP